MTTIFEQCVLRICSCDVSSDHLMMMIIMMLLMTMIVSDGHDLWTRHAPDMPDLCPIRSKLQCVWKSFKSEVNSVEGHFQLWWNWSPTKPGSAQGQKPWKAHLDFNVKSIKRQRSAFKQSVLSTSAWWGCSRWWKRSMFSQIVEISTTAITR